MNDNTTLIITQVISISGAILGAIVGAVLTHIFNKKHEEKAERLDKEKIRREKLSKSYKYILKYINKVQFITTKDVLNSMKNSTKYDGLETSEIIYKMYSDLEKYDSNKEKYSDEIKELEDSIELLRYNERMYIEACEIEEEFKNKEYEVFLLYASREVKMAWSRLKVIVDSGYKRNSKSEYKAFILDTDDKYHDNIFVDAYEELYEAIRKDLDITIQNDLISKYNSLKQ